MIYAVCLCILLKVFAVSAAGDLSCPCAMPSSISYSQNEQNDFYKADLSLDGVGEKTGVLSAHWDYLFHSSALHIQTGNELSCYPGWYDCRAVGLLKATVKENFAMDVPKHSEVSLYIMAISNSEVTVKLSMSSNLQLLSTCSLPFSGENVNHFPELRPSLMKLKFDNGTIADVSIPNC